MSGTVSPHLGKLDPSGIKNSGVSPPSEEDRAAHQRQAPRRLKNDSSGNTTMGTSPPARHKRMVITKEDGLTGGTTPNLDGTAPRMVSGCESTKKG